MSSQERNNVYLINKIDYLPQGFYLSNASMNAVNEIGKMYVSVVLKEVIELKKNPQMNSQRNRSISSDDVWSAINNLEELDFMDVPVMEELHAKKQRTYYRRGDHNLLNIYSNTLHPAFYAPLPPEQDKETQQEEEQESTTPRASSSWLNDCFYT